MTGASIFNQKTVEFEFRPGPLFAQVVLADEINRTTPRTQAALLEAMAESRVTVDGVTHRLGPPFLVIATQNPVDHEGTFPLPEAQLDRFLMRFSLGYPTLEEELKMLEMLQRSHPIDSLEPVVTAEELVACQKAVREIYVDDKVRRYLMQIVHDTRSHDDIGLGGSPRASIALFRTSQAMAALRGRNYVLPDDVKKVAGRRADAPHHPEARKPAAKSHRRRRRRRDRRGDCGADAGGEGGVVWDTIAAVDSRQQDCLHRIHEMARRRDSAARHRHPVRPGSAGVCDVRAAGGDAGQPLSHAELGRVAGGDARVQSARRRKSARTWRWS